MGIIDKVTSLLPLRHHGREERGERSTAAFEALALRDDLDRWVQRFFEEPWGLSMADYPHAPLPEIQDTERELIIKVQVPGLDREDLDLTITPEGLVVRGERREEQGTGERSIRFVQTVPLPPGLDLDRAQAQVQRGVLTIAFPKTEARPHVRRIPVTA
jgi:HSP20 family protein